MKKVYFQRWVFGKVQDVETSIKVLDGYNKTRYSLKKDKSVQLLEEGARNAHENGLIYFVTIFENEKPYCFLEINKGFYRVCFLDAFFRKYMSYDFTDNFRAINPDKLFLSSITFWEFEGSTDKTLKNTDHIFKPDGTFLVIERHLVTNEQIESDAKNKIDVSMNWEEYPEFGKYDSLVRKERVI
jgi:hypothetical protein